MSSPGPELQIHTMDADGWGDLDTARDLVDSVASAELFLYPGDGHLFTDDSLLSYDHSATALVKERVLSFLGKVE